MLEPVLNNPWVRAVVLLLALVLVVFLAYLLSPVLVPLFFAFIVAYIFDPVVDFIEARGISRGISIATLALLSILIVIGVPLLFVPWIVYESDQLVAEARERAEQREEQPEDEGGISAWVGERLRVEERLRWFVETVGWDEELGESYDENDPLSAILAHISIAIRERGLSFLQTHGREVAIFGQSAGESALQVLRAIGRGLLDAVLLLANIALFGFVAVYLLKDFDSIIWNVKQLIPPRHQSKVFEITKRIDENLRSFLRGQLLVVLCLGVMYAIGLSIAQIPFALLIAVVGAILSFIPYLGLVLTIGPAIILCVWWHQGVDWHLAVVIATFAVAQFLEGTVITPKIVGDKVGLGPVWVILAVLVFGNAMGFLGLLLAVPIAAIIKVFAVEGIEAYKRSKFFQSSAAGG